MQKVLREQLSWAHECNGKLKKTYAFVLASANLKALPLADVDVASRLRFDFRGDAQSIAMREVSTLMRDSSTKLPFWRSATAYDGVPNLLRALEGWLGADARTADSGKPRAQLRTTSPLPSLTSQCSLSHSHAMAAGSATSEARGFALTQRALGLAQADGGQRRRSAAGAPRPRFVLCNGQAAVGGGAQVAWANAYACRCGIRLTEEVKKALSRDQRRKRCGKAGRTRTQSDARAKGKSTRAAGAATSGKRKRE